MDVRFVNPVIDAMMNVLLTMAQMESQTGKPQLKANTQALGPVSSMMNMVGKQARGSIAITFSEAVIVDIARRMLGEDIEPMDETAKNLTGEITNMVVGGAKNTLGEQGFEFEMSTPSVISGEAYEIKHQYGEQTIMMPLRVESGEFYIELCFESRN